MRIGYVSLPGRGETDQVLAALAARLQADGQALAGAVQHNIGAEDCRCDMDLQILPDGPVLRISQNLGTGSQGCRLDAAVLETAVVAVAQRLPGASLLILNKFGKHEAEGRGFRQMLADAAASGLPVLIGLPDRQRQAFAEFAGDLAEEVAPARLHDWALAAIAGVA